MLRHCASLMTTPSGLGEMEITGSWVEAAAMGVRCPWRLTPSRAWVCARWNVAHSSLWRSTDLEPSTPGKPWKINCMAQNWPFEHRNSKGVMTCTKLWLEWIISFQITANFFLLWFEVIWNLVTDVCRVHLYIFPQATSHYPNQWWTSIVMDWSITRAHSCVNFQHTSCHSRGKGDYHRLGHGTDDHVRRPRRVTALQGKKVISIACGSLHCVACTDTGRMSERLHTKDFFITQQIQCNFLVHV